MKISISLFFLFLFSTLRSQWKDDFQTGIDPLWIGDRTHFMVNANQQLQLSAASAGSSSLFHPFDNSDSLIWMFYFKMEFAPSASNRMNIYLMTDRFNQDSSNAYVLEIGENGSIDNWKFYVKQMQSKILSGEGNLAALGGDPSLARMKIQKNKDNSWTFSTDYSGNSQFTIEKIIPAVPDLSISNPLFGFECFYTDTRKDKFFFDDLCITIPVNDTTSPQIVHALVISDTVLQIQFDAPIDTQSALRLSNYLLDGSIMPVQSRRISPDKIDLQFQIKFLAAKNYRLRYDSISDLNGNFALNQFFDFISDFTIQPSSLDLLITEIMADPTPVIGLPEKEFIEITNRSKTKLDLSDCILTDGSGESKFPSYQIDVDDYLILCAVKDTSEFKKFGNVLGLVGFPSLNNTGDLIRLRNQNGEIIHEVNYEDSWYRSSIKKEGGYSLEMINTGNICAGKENWIASEYFSGGTPGAENSVSSYHADLEGPKLFDAYPLNEFEIKLVFNESIHKNIKNELQQISLTPSKNIASVDLLAPSDNELILTLSESLEKGIQYKVNLEMLPDCLGNTSRIESQSFALPSDATYEDLVWSEVLFNPFSGGSDFVELYNRSNKVLSLNTLLIRNTSATDTTWYPVTTDRIILPGNYIALTMDPGHLLQIYFKNDSSKIITMRIPSIDDDGGSLQLATNQSNNLILLDSFTFSKGWHHPFIQDEEGVSLEKIDMNAASANRNNWQSAASSFGYATPGLQNSHFADTTTVADEKPYSLSSIIISPNGDSHRDFLSISFHLDKAGYKSRIEIYNLSGQKIKSISHALLSANDLIVWNGDNESGSILPVGNYVLYMELLHPDGDKMQFKERLVVDY
jgi:hypothetical protein